MNSEFMSIRTVPIVRGGQFVKEFETVIEVGDDFALTLSPGKASMYASALAITIAQAEHEWALVALATRQLGLEPRAIAVMLRDIREATPRPVGIPEIQWSALTSETSTEPQMTVQIQGKPPGQTTVAGAREHLLTIMTGAPTARLDTTTLEVMTDPATYALPENTVRGMLAAMGEYRYGPAETDGRPK